MSKEFFEKRVTLPVSSAEAFAWHERPGAIDRLIPPWEKVEVASRGEGIQDGSRVELVVRNGPLKLRWIALHSDYQTGKQFRDTQESGPFRTWQHTHSFESHDANSCQLIDSIEYQIPGGYLGRLLAGPMIRKKVESMFTYRHETTSDDLSAQVRHASKGIQRIAITGASGLVGSTLSAMLKPLGHQVSPLVRREPQAGEVRWDPAAANWDAGALDGIDCVVHLAGKSIAAGRWTESLKREIRDSRVNGTRVLAEGLARLASPPKVLVSASAIGYYGEGGDEVLDEESPNGDSFLAEVARDWEEATRPAAEAGIRVVNARLGVVLSPKDGALKKMLLPFLLGGGGNVGSGKQYWSWISVDDAAGALHHCMMTDELQGPVNLVSPQFVTNGEFTAVLGRVLRRPTLFPMPAFAARLALGEMADELLLSSLRVKPGQLEATGYAFRHPTLEEALRHLLGRPASS